MNGMFLPGTTADVTPKIARFLANLDRRALETVAEAAIARLDEIDGDSDLELVGDEADSGMGEDEHHNGVAAWLGAAGCPVSDPDKCVDDDGEPIDECEPDADSLCGEYGIDQSRMVSRTTAFASMNGMSSTDIAIAGMPDSSMRLRIPGRLSLPFGAGRASA